MCEYACFAGDGGPGGAGLSHAAAGVLGRGAELVGSPAIGESKNPRTHLQTLQVAGVSGQQPTPARLFAVTF